MQVLYVFMLLMILAITMFSGMRKPPAEEGVSAAAIAQQMAIWHRAATEACIEPGADCPDGMVNVRPYLPPMVRDGDAYVRNSFSSRYDSASGRLATYVSGPFIRQVGDGAVSGALYDMLRAQEQSSNLGVWRAATREVVISMPPPVPAPRSIVLPAVFAGIPDGSPILIAIPRQ